MEIETADFDAWWRTQHQTIGRVAAQAAWDAAWKHRDGEETREDEGCREADHLLNDGDQDPQWRAPEIFPDYRVFTGQLVPIKRD